MAYDTTGRLKPTKPKKQKEARFPKRKRDDVDIENLQRGVDELNLKAPLAKFIDLPLSKPTAAGLKQCHFSTLTEIQAKAIPIGLKGSDILGAAKTGSGKTLAFIIPVLENLYRQQCVGTDAGLCAMIISPTRELAIQIFDVLYKVGKCGHLFAAGLIIGGKSLREEQQALTRMNIVVCTPGRMLQHLSQTAAFNVDNLRMLVLDEADRILDMGFQRDVDAIVEYLPQERQTLLFSATQTKKVSDLARLSLRDPEYISVHETATSATPKTLQQSYVLTPLATKLDTLWSFVQSSKKSKLLVFLSAGKQVRFVYETFRQLQPGIPLYHLHGRQKQGARLDTTKRFASAQHACLFATDVVARGLDFPAVEWVVQVDCPEDADTYIHRVGRTARFEREGRAVLFLDPSEEQGMLERLASKKVPIERINVRSEKQQSIKNKLQALCFKDPELKYLGQKAFVSYVRSLHVQKDKDIFKLGSYLLEDYAASLGLPGAPRIKFAKGDAEAAKKAKNAPRQPMSDPESDAAVDKKAGVRTKYDRMFQRKNQDILSSHYSRMIANDDESESGSEAGDLGQEPGTGAVDGTSAIARTHSKMGNGATAELIEQEQDEEDDLFTVKRRFPVLDSEPQQQEQDQQQPKATPVVADSKRRIRALQTRKGAARLLGLKPGKVVFDDDGNPHDRYPFKNEEEIFPAGNGDIAGAQEAARREFVLQEGEKMRGADVVDRENVKDRKRMKKQKRKQREREEAEEEMGAVAVTVGGGDWNDSEEQQGMSDESDYRAGSRESRSVSREVEEQRSEKRTRVRRERPPAETLEDLEALASGLLG